MKKILLFMLLSMVCFTSFGQTNNQAAKKLTKFEEFTSKTGRITKFVDVNMPRISESFLGSLATGIRTIMGSDRNGGTGFFCGRALTIANLKTCVRRYILSPKDSTFASMNQNNDIDMYKGLAVYFLPEGVLNYFDVVAFAEEPPKKNDVLYSSELHIYLDEKDNRTSDMQGSKSKGYTEDKQILDFPVRGRKAVIHIRRKRWLMPDGSCQVVDLHKKVEIEYKGTRYSKEFALFLKMATGQ
jgi:hypothetical protein